MIAFLILAGLVIGLWLGRWPWYVALIVVLISVIYAGHRYRFKGGLILFCCLAVGGGLCLIDTVTPSIQEQYQGIVISSKENYFLFYSSGHRYYIYEKDNTRELGDCLKIKGTRHEINFTTYESRFDFKSYLSDKGVRFEIRPVSMEVIFANPLRINQRKTAFLKNFDESTASLLDALLFSNRDSESILIRNVSSMNLVFLFSMCGVYLRSVMAFVEYLLKLKLSDRTARIVTMIVSCPLITLSFEKIAVHRLLTIYGLRIANDYLLKKQFSYCTLTALVGLAFFLGDFHLAYQMSFLMGFGLSFLMIFLRLPIKVFPRRIRKILLLLMVFIFLMPIHIALTHELHFFQALFQCLAIPLNTIYFVIGVFSFYTLPLAKLLSSLTWLINGILSFLARFDLKIAVGEVSFFYYLTYYCLFFAFLYFVEGHRLVISKKLMASMLLTIMVASLPIRNVLFEAIHFINVGQGDAILIQSRDANILIDTGGNLGFDMAAEVLIPFFRKKMVRQIDYLITTHDDFDHNGAASSLKALFPVKNEIVNDYHFPLTLDHLSIANLNKTYHGDSNDDSLVLTFSFMNRSWLLMGDASTSVEKEIMEANPTLDIDMLKVAHHGSKTATSNAFIAQITPVEAIISVGANNYYAHPHDEVLTLLARHQIIIRRTDLEGTISYYRRVF